MRAERFVPFDKYEGVRKEVETLRVYQPMLEAGLARLFAEDLLKHAKQNSGYGLPGDFGEVSSSRSGWDVEGTDLLASLLSPNLNKSLKPRVFSREKNLIYPGAGVEFVELSSTHDYFGFAYILSVVKDGKGTSCINFCEVRQADDRHAEVVNFYNPLDGEARFRRILFGAKLLRREKNLVYVVPREDEQGTLRHDPVIQIAYRRPRKGMARQLYVRLDFPDYVRRDELTGKSFIWEIEAPEREGGKPRARVVSSGEKSFGSEQGEYSPESYLEVCLAGLERALCDVNPEFREIFINLKNYLNPARLDFRVPEFNIITGQ